MLMLLMIFALADAQTFLLFGTVGIIDHSSKLGEPALMTMIGLVYALGFVGLYRLHVWGALLNAGLSAVVLVLLFTTPMLRDFDLRLFLGLLAGAHVLVAAPVGLSVLGGRQLPALPPRVRGAVTTLVIGLLMTVSLVMFLRESAW
jgi:hypothetical protein